MTDNLALWHQVEKTDPSQVKEITGKTYKGNSPKPHYLIKKATETFGPCGIGWGFKVLDERIVDGAMLADGFYEKMSIARVSVWFKWNGERSDGVEHVGGTVFSGKRKSGQPFTDEDAPKKSITDALVKALSMIGFAGDIFMGRYDDSKYVDELKTEAREEKRREAADEITAYVARAKTAMQNEDTRDGLIAYWTGEKAARETLRLLPNSPDYDGLYSAYKARGIAIAKSQTQHQEAAE